MNPIIVCLIAICVSAVFTWLVNLWANSVGSAALALAPLLLMGYAAMFGCTLMTFVFIIIELVTKCI